MITITIPDWGVWLAVGVMALPVLYWLLIGLDSLVWRGAADRASREWLKGQHRAALARRGLRDGKTVFSESLRKLG